MCRVQKVMAAIVHYQIGERDGNHRAGNFLSGTHNLCHICMTHRFVNNAAGTVAPNTLCSDISISGAACFTDFLDTGVL